jgi:DNA polymerase-1
MSDQKKELFLLDAFALIFRAYFAFARNPRVTSKGVDTSAIYGFLLALFDVLQKKNPSHVAVVFDLPKPTKRHEIFPEYKANRNETPEAIKIAVPYIKKILDGLNIPALGVEGYEADDVIGTLAKKAEKEGYTTYMMTPDKDFGQLVSENIFMFRPGRSGNPPEVWGTKEVCEKFGIERVEQVIDFLGMMGDAVDNIPGLPGVGQKTAQKLLAQYGSLEETLENADEIKGKLGEKIRDNKEQGILSKHLATIMLDVPIEFDPDDLLRGNLNSDIIRPIFEELEFRSLSRKLMVEVSPEKKEPVSSQPVISNISGQGDLFAAPANPVSTDISGFKDLSNTDHYYQLIEDVEDVKLLCRKLCDQTEVCFDTETTSINAVAAELVGIAFSFAKGKAYYLNLPTVKSEVIEILKHLVPFFENENVLKIGQNIKYDVEVLLNYSITVKGELFDTMLAHYLIQPDMRHNMDVLAETYLSYKPQSIEELIGKKGKKQGSMRDVDPVKVAEYAGEDADITFQLKEFFAPKLKEDKVWELYRNIETPLINVLADMEHKGVKVDEAGLNAYSVELHKDLLELDSSIKELAGVDFLISSPKQLGEVLFDKLKLVEKPKKTKSGQYATGEDILVSLKGKHEIIDKILSFREIGKLKSTYVDALPREINPNTGRIHTSFNQAVAATGRLSSNNPNLQNIPIRSERGKKIRAMFIPSDADHVLLAADYSQIELRIIASISKDKAMIEAFNAGEDIHTATAARVFGIESKDVTREQRSHAKTVNFGIIYGVSAFGLSNQTNLSRKESKELIDSYFESYPGIKSYIDSQVIFARENGYVETLMGRKRYLKDINSANAVVRGHAERNAMNAPIQGSAADIIKLAMINVHAAMAEKGFKSNMILQVHDELVFDARLDELDALKELIKDKMESAIKLDVPLIADLGTGNNWLEAH